LRAAALLVLAACGGEVGTITVELTTAPSSTVLDGVTKLQLTITEPLEVFESERSADGFSFSIDIPANGSNGALVVDGFDASGARIATGKSPPFPVAAINARIVVYMAAPMTLAASPVMISPRDDFATGNLSYGVIFVGGRDATGAASTQVEVYNAYDHTLLVGAPLPAARIRPPVAVAGSSVLIFGGSDGTNPTSTFWQFDTTIAPAGGYNDLPNPQNFATGSEIATQIDTAEFAVTGTPPLVIAAATTTIVPLEGTLSLPSIGLTVTPADQIPTAVFAGAGAGTAGLLQVRGTTLTDIPGGSIRVGHSVAEVAGGKVLVLGGGDGTTLDGNAIVVEAGLEPTATVTPNVLATPRSGCALAATSAYVIAAGGTAMDGSILADAEILDPTTLAHVTTIPLVVPRTGAIALTLPNDQILVAGGVDAAGAPIGTIELFTPDK
jgi:hypothetical protein